VPIAFEDVSFSYHAPATKKRAKKGVSAARKGAPPPPEAWALKDIDFCLEDGEFFGIAGHTGSGKSTLIQHTNGLLHPTVGRVLVDGQDILDKKEATRARSKVGLVFQYPEYQLFAATVYDDVAFGPRNMGLAPDAVDACVHEALAQVALDFDTVQGRSPFELSGGQQRRVAFAGVLAMKPSVLVLDEPVAGLDPAARRDFLGLITGFHDEGLTVVIVSHNMDDLARLCDRILVLKEGEMLMLGTPEEVFSHEGALREVGLGVPAAQRMANSLKGAGLDLEGGLYDTARLADSLAALYHAAVR
jgi:energy-coupling factor transport system ATP-binding protein